jgi:hypothetical protein
MVCARFGMDDNRGQGRFNARVVVMAPRGMSVHGHIDAVVGLPCLPDAEKTKCEAQDLGRGCLQVHSTGLTLSPFHQLIHRLPAASVLPDPAHNGMA